MSLLQFIVIVAAVVFIFFGLDLYKRKKMNILHFLVFIVGGGVVVIFWFNQELLNQFGKFFGIARGADLLVYISLIVLFYFYITMLNNHTKDKFQLTKLISQTAIDKWYLENKEQIAHRKNKGEKDDFVFNIRIYNEDAAVVTKVIDEIIDAGFRKFVFINDGSSTNILEVLQEKKKQHPDKLIIILSHAINRGWGAANQTGYNFIKKYGDELKIKRFVGFDADGQMDVKDMETFIKHIHTDQTLDLYLWSRFIVGGKAENMPKMRWVIQIFAKLITRILYWTKVSDPHNGYRVISLPTLRKFVLTADGMHYANEVNEQIKRYHMKYREIPVHIRYTDYSMNSTSKWHRNKNSDSLKLAAEMIYKKIFFR